MKVREKTKEKTAAGRPYAERLLNDEELRQIIRHAVKAGKGIYRELKGESPARAAERLATDKKLRKHLGHVIDDSRQAKSRLEGRPAHKLRKVFLIGLIIAGVYALRERFSDDSDSSSGSNSSNNGRL